MLFTFLKKQTNRKKQRKLIETMITSLNISLEQKELYVNALWILKEDELEALYKRLSQFVEKVELKEIDEIKKQSFTEIAGMRKKEAEEKLEEMNNFSFLLHNL